MTHLALNITLWLSTWFHIQNCSTYSEALIYTNFSFRNDDQEEESQKVQLFSVDPIVCSETKPHTLGSDMGLSESCIKEPEREDSNGDTVLTLNVSEVKECKIYHGGAGCVFPT